MSKIRYGNSASRTELKCASAKLTLGFERNSLTADVFVRREG